MILRVIQLYAQNGLKKKIMFLKTVDKALSKLLLNLLFNN